MYTLYYSPGAANMAVHTALIQTGAPYRLSPIDLDKDEQKSPAFLAINPVGRVPALTYDGDKSIYEAAAICLFLAERHPEAGLAPAPGAPERGPFLQWMAYLTNTPQEAMLRCLYPEKFIEGEAEQARFKKTAEASARQIWEFLDRQLALQGPFLCGQRPFVCDTYLSMIARWSRLIAYPAIGFPSLRKLVAATIATPAYARMLKEEGLEQIA